MVKCVTCKKTKGFFESGDSCSQEICDIWEHKDCSNGLNSCDDCNSNYCSRHIDVVNHVCSSVDEETTEPEEGEDLIEELKDLDQFLTYSKDKQVVFVDLQESSYVETETELLARLIKEGYEYKGFTRVGGEYTYGTLWFAKKGSVYSSQPELADDKNKKRSVK